MGQALSLVEAIAYHRAGNLEIADDIYEKLLNNEPLNVQLLSLRGLVAQSLLRLERATEFFNRANQLLPNDPNIQLQLGLLHTQMGDLTRANDFYQQAIQNSPNSVEPLVNYGNNLTKLHLFHEAFNVYQKALKINTNNAQIYFNMGTMFLEAMKPDNAIWWLEEAVRLDPAYAVAWNSLGVAHTEIGELKKAQVAYQKSVALDPQCIEPFFNLHAIYIDLGLSDLALESLQKAAEIDGQNKVLQFFLGMVYEYRGQADCGRPILDDLANCSEVLPELTSWKYVKNVSSSSPVLVGTNTQTVVIALEAATVDGLVLEFGVYNGKSIRRIASLINQTVHGFDSFEGIPEAWNDEPKGSYSAQGQLPSVPNNVTLHPGWFIDTLPAFVAQSNEPVRFLHIDCDLYSSTKTVFEYLASRIVSGTVIVFDEFIGYKSWQDDEFKAFIEAATLHSWNYRLLTFSFVTKQVAIQIE
jgi:tetratricopeptide (TPR) repeat protein